MSNLVDHAQRELRLLGYTGEEPEDDPNRWMYDGVMDLVKLFAEQGHSGSSAGYMLHVLPKILNFENLTPLTNNSEDWIEVGPDTWQNRRRSEAFSEDGGHTYYLLSEVRYGWKRKLFGKAPIHRTEVA